MENPEIMPEKEPGQKQGLLDKIISWIRPSASSAPPQAPAPEPEVMPEPPAPPEPEVVAEAEEVVEHVEEPMMSGVPDEVVAEDHAGDAGVGGEDDGMSDTVPLEETADEAEEEEEPDVIPMPAPEAAQEEPTAEVVDAADDEEEVQEAA